LDQFAAVVNAELGVDGIDVAMHGPAIDTEAPGDLLDGLAGHDARGNVHLARREVSLAADSLPGLRAQGAAFYATWGLRFRLGWPGFGGPFMVLEHPKRLVGSWHRGSS
jgi:hypothetical protein